MHKTRKTTAYVLMEEVVTWRNKIAAWRKEYFRIWMLDYEYPRLRERRLQKVKNWHHYCRTQLKIVRERLAKFRQENAG